MFLRFKSYYEIEAIKLARLFVLANYNQCAKLDMLAAKKRFLL